MACGFIGESDVVAENNAIQNTAKEAISLGEYHYVDSWSSYKNEPENLASTSQIIR